MNNIHPLLMVDGYKLSHHLMYPEGTTLVYSNFTPRSNKHAKTEKVVSIGQQMFVQWLNETFNNDFFQASRKDAILYIKEELEFYLGTEFDCSHFAALYDLGYLPLEFKALPEGTLVPMKVPVLTIVNTHPDFGWLVNYLETIISNSLWQVMTSASIALEYRRILTKWALATDKDNVGFVDFQAHDFSMRGLSSIGSTQLSGFGHMAVFTGSDNLPAIHTARKHYGAKGFIIGGVPATEHSCMCAGTKEDELGTFRRLMEIFPTGLLSVVSDTWDLWKVLTEILPALKEEIITRDGKLVIRPDSGDPVNIICGHTEGTVDQDGIYFDRFGKKLSTAEFKGVIELLWDTFGGTINEQGYKVLDPHIGAIYGDSITLERAEDICKRLEAKGFASTNIVLGVGSFTYQMNTRDTYGFAMKATYIEVTTDYGQFSGGVWTEGREIFKDPVTDSGIKKSAKGLLQVYKVKGAHGESDYILKDQCTWKEEKQGELQTIFKDGKFFNTVTLETIRKRISSLT